MIKSYANIKIFFFIKIIFLYFALTLKCYSNSLDQNLIVLGTENALVKIKVFSSLTCPHCADFHNEVVSKIKKEYIDKGKGKVQLIFIDFPLDQAAFNASKLLNCVSEENQMEFLDIVYTRQEKWTDGSSLDDINKNLKKIVKNLGITSDQFQKCLTNEAISDKILNGRINANQKYSINSTPTIVINEKKLEGSASFENIKKNIDKLI